MSNLRPGPLAHVPYLYTFSNYDEIRKTFVPYLQKDGYFLLRNSMSGQQYCISVVHNKEIKHMRIDERNGSFILQDIHFQSLDKLVQYYKKNEIPNEEKIRHIKLLYPITRTNIEFAGASSRRGSDGEVRDQRSGLRAPNRTASMPTRRDARSKTQQADHSRSSLPTNMGMRPPATLPANALSWQVEVTGAPNTKPPEYCYDYAKITDHIEEVKKSIRLMDMEDAGELCQCGLLVADSKLPMDWTVHRSTEPETVGRVFFVSPNQESAWTLPAEVDALLTGEQRLFVEGLRQNAGR